MNPGPGHCGSAEPICGTQSEDICPFDTLSPSGDGRGGGGDGGCSGVFWEVSSSPIKKDKKENTTVFPLD